jgi:hypothetical protein
MPFPKLCISHRAVAAAILHAGAAISGTIRASETFERNTQLFNGASPDQWTVGVYVGARDLGKNSAHPEPARHHVTIGPSHRLAPVF